MQPLRPALSLIRASFLAGLLALPAQAGSGIEIADPWARPSIPNRPGVVYLAIHNRGDAPDRLVGARAEGVGAAELHEARQKDGVMMMAPVEAIEIPASGMAQLEPGGLHIMLFGLEAPLQAGDTLPLTLEFERAGDMPVSVPVTQGAPAGGHQHGGTQGHGGAGN